LGIGVKEMVRIIENYVGKLHENQISVKNSSKGKYVSITIRIVATSRQQLDSINADLQNSPLVSYLL
jgi:putative lipoic acid-binding regulatory protein